MATYMGYYPEDEVDFCCRCQEGPMYSNDKSLIQFESEMFCEDCLFEEIFTEERGKQYVLDWGGCDPEDEDAVREYVRNDIESFAMWYSEHKKGRKSA